MQRSLSWLWGLAITSLVLNLILLFSLNLVRLKAVESLTRVELMMDQLANEVIIYEVPIDQAVPIKADIPFNQTVETPINTVIPIDQVVTLPLQTPAGEMVIDVPLQTDFPLDLVLPVSLNEIIRVDTVVDLEASIPVEIDIARTPLTTYLDLMRRDVSRLRNLLSLGSAPPDSGSLNSSDLTTDARTTASSSTEQPASTASDDGTGSAPEQAAVDMRAISDAETEPDPCEHPYWPLPPSVSWTYAGGDANYQHQVEKRTTNQAQLVTTYGDSAVRSTIDCVDESLGGFYQFDLRRLTAFGDLRFTNLQGPFLPPAGMVEQPGYSWSQQFDVSGSISGIGEVGAVPGKIDRGSGQITFKNTGLEEVATPMGPREAIRIEQQLTIQLAATFSGGPQEVQASESIELTTVYWFVKRVGLAKIHWQGGTVRRVVPQEPASVEETIALEPLPEEILTSICFEVGEGMVQCLGEDRTPQTGNREPATGDAALDPLTLPGNPPSSATGATSPEALEALQDEPTASPDAPIAPQTGPVELPDETEDDSNESTPPAVAPIDDGAGDEAAAALARYVAAVISLGERNEAAASAFWADALAYSNNEISRDDLKTRFDDFRPQVRGVIDEARGLTPPPVAQAIHQKILNGLGNCGKAVDLMDAWFDDPASASEEEGMLLATSCVNVVQGAVNELTALVETN